MVISRFLKFFFISSLLPLDSALEQKEWKEEKGEEGGALRWLVSHISTEQFTMLISNG